MPWRFVCNVCGKVGHGRAKGWHEAPLPGIFRILPKAVGFQTVLFRWRGGGGRFFCPDCMEREYGEVLHALREYRG